MRTLLFAAIGASLVLAPAAARSAATSADIVHFKSQSLDLGGELFKPEGKGPFPAVLYNHGSAPGMLNSQASAAIGPLFAQNGWVFFMPYRRGQGLSADAGSYIVDEIEAARRRGGKLEGAATMTRLLRTDHLQDQLAALEWLASQSFVQADRIAVAGNSFGGVEAILGAAHGRYCAAVDASGGAESWSDAPELRELMKAAVKDSNTPTFFFQAENDFDLSPSKVLAAEMKATGKDAEIKIYARFGSTHKDGHSFAYRGSAVWFPDVIAFLQKHCVQ